MKVSRLAWRGVAALPDLECDFMSPATGRPHDLVIVSGPPASGKTRLCELVIAVLETVAPYQGIVRASDWYADAARGARVEMDLFLEDPPDAEGRSAPPAGRRARATVHFTADGVVADFDRALGKKLSKYSHDPAHEKREYFPENRQRAWGAREDGTGAPEQSLMRCSKDSQKYSFVPRLLAELRTDAARARTFASALEILSPVVRYQPAPRGGDPTACFESRGRQGIKLEELASSEADAALIAATHAMIGLNHSLVLLDRPELYIGPDRLAAWVHSLSAIGTNNQWIVATSDDRLGATVDRSQHIALGAHGHGERLPPIATPPSVAPSSWGRA